MTLFLSRFAALHQSFFIKTGLLALLCLLASLLVCWPVHAQSLIRDAEIEADIRTIADPIFENAGLNPTQIRIILIDDSTINAFVAEGQNLFLYSGLILEADSAAQLGGVIAHEAGHIAGGHLIRMRGIMERASIESVVASLAGIALGVGTGDANAGMATAMGGSEYAKRNFLRHSRGFESAADQSGMATLERLGLSAKGMAEFLEKLSGQEALPEIQRSSYVLTHPLSRDRMQSVEAFVAHSKMTDRPWPSEWEDAFQRAKAKLLAFTQPARAERFYAAQTNANALYGVAIAAYRQGRITEALDKITALEKSAPNDPYLKELRGQILYEQGRIAESIAAYRQASALAPEAGLIHLGLAQTLLQQESSQNRDAIDHLVAAQDNGEKDNPTVYRWLAVAYGRNGWEGKAKLALAEEALLKGDPDFALVQAERAKTLLGNDSSSAQRARDLITAAERMQTEKKKAKD